VTHEEEVLGRVVALLERLAIPAGILPYVPQPAARDPVASIR